MPPEWHGWLHYTVDTLPTDERYQPKPWQQRHQMNLTGTARAYRPKGSILGKRRTGQVDERLQGVAAASRIPAI